MSQRDVVGVLRKNRGRWLTGSEISGLSGKNELYSIKVLRDSGFINFKLEWREYKNSFVPIGGDKRVVVVNRRMVFVYSWKK